MKKYLVFAITLLLCLSGCSKEDEQGVSDSESIAIEATQTEEKAPVSEDDAEDPAMQIIGDEAVSEDDAEEDTVSEDEVIVTEPDLDPDERARIVEEKKLRIREKTLEVPGLTRELDILFLADIHISLCDERDGALVKRAQVRRDMMLDSNGRPADHTFHEFIDYCGAEKPELLILGGDITDSALFASVDFIKEELSGLSLPCIYSLGNHDFEYGPEYFSPKAYEVYRPRVLELSKDASGAHVTQMGGIYIFAVDDYNNQYSKEELSAFKEIYDKGKPVLFVSHVPLEPRTSDTTLHDKTIEIFGKDQKGNSRVLIGEHSCVPDKVTKEMTDMIFADDSPVFCVLSGHIHYAHEDMLNDRIVQIVTGAAFNSEAVLLHLEKVS